MTGAFDQVELAIPKTGRDVLREPMRKRAVLRPVPQRDGHAHFLEREPPRRRVDFGIGDYALRRRTPGLPGAFEANIESTRFPQNVRVAGLEKFQEEWTQPDRHSDCDKRPREMKERFH